MSPEKQMGPPEEQRATKTITIVQLSRLGDLIQTLLSIKQVRELNSDVQFCLVARKQFSSPLKFILKEAFDSIIEIDSKDIAFSSTDLASGQSKIQEVVQQINDLGSQVIINQTFSKASSYLCGLLKASFKLGPYYDDSHNLRIEDMWSQLVYASVMTGKYHPFNLVDNFRMAVSSNEISQTNTIEKINAKNLVISPFASQEKKFWSSQKWIDLIDKILREYPESNITLVGSSSEKEASKKIMASPLLRSFQKRITNITGETSLEELASTLKKTDLFVGHDSMSSHLAAYFGTPTVTVSLGTVRPAETAPYGTGHLILSPQTKCFPCFPSDECGFYQCHHDISTRAVLKSLSPYMSEKTTMESFIKSAEKDYHCGNVNIYITQFSELGLQETFLINQAEKSFDDFIRKLYRVIWLFFILEKEEKDSSIKASLSATAAIRELGQGLQYLFDLSEFGKKYSRYILDELASKTPRIEKIKEYSGKIDEIDGLQEALIENYPSLRPIVSMFKLQRATLAGENLAQLSQSSYLNYNEMSLILSAMHEMAQNIIRTSSPRTIRNQPKD